MHIVINATEIGRRRGGNESYIAGLLEGLTELQPAQRISLLSCRWDPPAEFPPGFERVDIGPYRRFPFLFWQQTQALRRVKADWYLSNFFMPWQLPCRGAVVVHDLSFRAHPGYFPRSVAWYMHWLVGRAVRQASRVLTVSEFSRRELLHYYPVDEEKVAIVPDGVGERFRPAADAAETEADRSILGGYGINQPYILAVGNIHPRKNLARLLAAYVNLQQEVKDLPPMVWAGIQRWDSGDLLDRARATGSVILPGYIAGEHLPALYRQAQMLVYPSLYEGFGLPPLEAMACGTPVIASRTTSLPDVVGEAGLLVDPTSVDEIAGAIRHLLDDEAVARRLRAAGQQRAERFSWTAAARKLLAALET